MWSENEPGKKPEPHELKQQAIAAYFGDQQQPFDQAFVDLLFSIAHQDPSVDALIHQHSAHLLASSQACNHLFFSCLLSSPPHAPIALRFVDDLINLRITIRNRAFELFLIQSLPSILRSLLGSAQVLKTTVTYLALRMRSFDQKIRVTALRGLKELGEGLDSVEKEWDEVFRRTVPLMIEKEKLAREMSYIKGLFLHVLEDELNEVRQVCIQTLILFRRYLRPGDLKLIVIYMLNDEHEVVREEALKASQHLRDQDLGKEDIETIMMCLRERRTNMRQYVYETLATASLNKPSLLLLILDKVLPTLQSNKSDKKCIYRMLMSLGRRYSGWVEGLLEKLLVLEQAEPNWKSITYKAKMVLCHHWWSQLPSSHHLPLYFPRHMLYIRDMEPYLFREDFGMREESPLINLRQVPPAHLASLLECEEEISQEFHRTLLGLLRAKITSQLSQPEAMQKVEQLALIYQLKEEETRLVEDLCGLIQLGEDGLEASAVVDLLTRCIRSREQYEEGDTTVPVKRCQVSKAEPNLIVAARGLPFQERVVLKCYLHSLISKEPRVEYKRIASLPRVREDEESSYLGLSLTRFTRVDCLLVMPNGSHRLLDSYSAEVKL